RCRVGTGAASRPPHPGRHPGGAPALLPRAGSPAPGHHGRRADLARGRGAQRDPAAAQPVERTLGATAGRAAGRGARDPATLLDRGARLVRARWRPSWGEARPATPAPPPASRVPRPAGEALARAPPPEPARRASRGPPR